MIEHDQSIATLPWRDAALVRIRMVDVRHILAVTPAQAGVHCSGGLNWHCWRIQEMLARWIPAFAGMTDRGN